MTSPPSLPFYLNTRRLMLLPSLPPRSLLLPRPLPSPFLSFASPLFPAWRLRCTRLLAQQRLVHINTSLFLRLSLASRLQLHPLLHRRLLLPTSLPPLPSLSPPAPQVKADSQPTLSSLHRPLLSPPPSCWSCRRKWRRLASRSRQRRRRTIDPTCAASLALLLPQQRLWRWPHPLTRPRRRRLPS